jgi:hypothetical protein
MQEVFHLQNGGYYYFEPELHSSFGDYYTNEVTACDLNPPTPKYNFSEIHL